MRILYIVVENVVESERKEGCVQFLLNILDSLLQVLSLGFHLLEFVEIEYETGHRGAAHEICICVVRDQKGAMIDDSTPA